MQSFWSITDETRGLLMLHIAFLEEVLGCFGPFIRCGLPPGSDPLGVFEGPQRVKKESNSLKTRQLSPDGVTSNAKTQPPLNQDMRKGVLGVFKCV